MIRKKVEEMMQLYLIFLLKRVIRRKRQEI